MLMINFSDVEVAHSGTYSLHLGGVSRTDQLCHRMWALIQSTPSLCDGTTLIVMNEFGRDPDGSGTNGFFNHRTNTESLPHGMEHGAGTGRREAPGCGASRPADRHGTLDRILDGHRVQSGGRHEAAGIPCLTGYTLPRI